MEILHGAIILYYLAAPWQIEREERARRALCFDLNFADVWTRSV